MAAIGAAVVAEVPDIRGGVLVGRPAANAVLRVGGVLKRGTRDSGVVDAEDDGARVVLREVADLRVVTVEDECRVRRERTDGFAPAGRHVLELAVAVELVAEEVAEADAAWADPRRHLRQRRLVDLEQTELRAPRVEQSRCDTGNEIRA